MNQCDMTEDSFWNCIRMHLFPVRPSSAEFVELLTVMVLRVIISQSCHVQTPGLHMNGTPSLHILDVFTCHSASALCQVVLPVRL